jgi:hypothetical protein
MFNRWKACPQPGGAQPANEMQSRIKSFPRAKGFAGSADNYAKKKKILCGECDENKRFSSLTGDQCLFRK